MLKKWMTEIVALTLSFGTQAALEGAQSPQMQTGTQIVLQVDEAYQRGEYDHFLKSLHAQYESAGKAGILHEVFTNAKKGVQNKRSKNFEQSQRKLAQLGKERNVRLLQAISENPYLEIVRRVDSVVMLSWTEEQESILAELDMLKFDIPSAEGTIESQISAIETEYYLKSLLLDIGDFEAKKKRADLERKKILLQLAKFDKMKEAAQEYVDKSWEEKIEKAKVGFCAKSAYAVDYEILKNLASGKIKPQNSIEEKVKEIMMEYQSQRELGFSDQKYRQQMGE